MLNTARLLHRSNATLALTAVGLACLPHQAAAQAIVGTVDGSGRAVVFSTPAIGLPTPSQVNVTGLPIGAQPHGVSHFGSDFALVADANNSRVFVIQISNATLVDTIPTNPSYRGTGSIAVAPGSTAALASGGSARVTVIAAPFNALSTLTTVPLTGQVATYQTEAIVFDAAGRAFVYQTAGISVIEPPYTSVAFTIAVPSNSASGAIAITPDGQQLLFTNLTGAVGIITAPYSVTSVVASLSIPGGDLLDGICVSPDGTKVLVVSVGAVGATEVFAISAPYSAASAVESIPLTGGPYGDGSIYSGFEDVGISQDGQLAILTGQGSGNPHIPFVRAPFTTAGATIFDVSIPGGRGQGAVRFPSPGPGTAGCCGDGSVAACPCGINGATCNGCPNSFNAAGANLTATGSPNSEYPAFVTEPDTVTFTASGLPPTVFAILFKGTSTISPNVFGDGLRCCGGPLRRLAAHNAVGGSFSFGYPVAKVSVAGHSLQGEHACYQLYYRDPNLVFCLPGFNVTNSYQITWL